VLLQYALCFVLDYEFIKLWGSEDVEWHGSGGAL
jgi:hypothetical protein